MSGTNRPWHIKDVVDSIPKMQHRDDVEADLRWKTAPRDGKGTPLLAQRIQMFALGEALPRARAVCPPGAA